MLARSSPQACMFPVQSTRYLLPATALAWRHHFWHLLRYGRSQGLFRYGHVWWKVTERWRITSARAFLLQHIFFAAGYQAESWLSAGKELSEACLTVAQLWGDSSDLRLGVAGLIWHFFSFFLKLVKIFASLLQGLLQLDLCWQILMKAFWKQWDGKPGTGWV